jgi:haloalkane dehalogenase
MQIIIPTGEANSSIRKLYLVRERTPLSKCLQKRKEYSMISAAFPYQKKRKSVLGLEMAYVDEGQGDPIIFLHGNPNSSYSWRNIMPYVQRSGRIIAPDLIGMGDSQKLPASGPTSYTFVEHRRYLDALLEALDVSGEVIFVGHDWGSALAFDWAYRHPQAVRGIAYMEAIVKPYTWSEFPEAGREVFQALRSPAGEQMVLEQNSFVEFNMTASIMRTLAEEEMNEYRRPFAEPGEGRRPTLTWPRQIPIDGEPADVTEIVTTYGKWLASSSMPKLFIQGDPGRMQPNLLAFCSTWPSQSTVVVKGLHNLHEDSPDEIGQAIADWLQHLK